MKDRLDLWDGENSVLGWVERQGRVQGLGLVDFNYPQHLSGLTVDAVGDALAKAGLAAGAVCLRFPKDMQLGAFTHPDPAVRAKAVQLTIEAGEWARALGADEVVVWSAFDGYDCTDRARVARVPSCRTSLSARSAPLPVCQLRPADSLQADYRHMWRDMVDCFRQACDACPGIKVSLEYKPTDENTRFFAVPSTGAAMLLVNDVDRENFGLTLDVGHCLAAGENPAQSVAMVAQRGKLFGIQLNDGYQRLGAEDGLMFASVHPLMALELVWWLQELNYTGHLYFDTFPRNEDPVKEAEYNILQFKALWRKAQHLRRRGISRHMAAHDALGALAMLADADSPSA